MILNNSPFSVDEINIIKNKKITILGLGGLGGNIANMLVRLGAEKLTIIDFDVFDITNLNRQLFSNSDTIGEKKTKVISREIKKINSNLDIVEYDIKIDSNNSADILKYSDIVFDGLDNIETRIIAINTCKELAIPFVFCSVGGFYGYVSVIADYTKNNIVDIIKYSREGNINNKNTNSFTVSAVAAVGVSECIKYILNNTKSVNKIITIDLYNNSIKTINI